METEAPWSGVLADWPVRLCVAVLVTDPEGRVALIESAKPGRDYEIPGGGVNLGEEPVDAAIREMAEEAGLRLARDAVEHIDTLPGTPKPGAMYASRILVFRASAEGELRAGSDAKGAAWFTAGEVLLLADFDSLSDLTTTRDVLLPWARAHAKRDWQFDRHFRAGVITVLGRSVRASDARG